MAKTAEIAEVAVSKLRPYENNAKIHGQNQIDKLKKSIEEFGFLSPCLIDRDFNIIAGHGRVMAANELGIKTVPCVFVEGLTEAQRKAYILADNKIGEYGEWDLGLIEAELLEIDLAGIDIDLTGFELKDDWFETRERNDRSRQEGNDEYNEFLDKFEILKTTDDCYTPDNIYETVCNYVVSKYGVEREKFCRPFYPGGDYQAYKYSDGSVVVDNPPFSILAEIADFYVERKQPFFLFSPSLSTIGLTRRDGVAVVACGASITYENGASVQTSFITNLEPENIIVVVDPGLYQMIEAANKENEKECNKQIPRYEYPNEVLTSAMCSRLSKYGQNMVVKRKDAAVITCLDSQKDKGKTIFGAGLLLSEKAAAVKAAAEKAAAEKAAAVKWELSEREREIIRNLGEGE